MRITRLYLRNYRVYEQELDLEIPAGLVGIMGPNGAGKSYLIEAIPWTLFGVSRTAKDDVRTSGVNAECVTEVEFEHEGTLYLVRRTISGQNNTVKAEAHANRLQVAEGVNDTKAYVQSILGMDAAAFKASVFAEQKQLSAFSQESPAKRRDLVLRLLGITPLDAARDNARRDARTSRDAHDQARRMLPDVAVLQTTLDDAAATVTTAEPALGTARRDAEEAARTVDELEERFTGLDAVREAHNQLVTTGQGVKADRDDAASQIARLDAELSLLRDAEASLVQREREAQPLDRLERQLTLARRVADAARALHSIGTTTAPPEPDEAMVHAAEADASQADAALAGASAQFDAAAADEKRAADAARRSASLTGEGDCPMCGQSLGDAFETVVAHRQAELDAATARRTEWQAAKTKATVAAKETRARLEAARRSVAGQRSDWSGHLQAVARQQVAADTLAEAARALEESAGDDEAVDLVALETAAGRAKQAAKDAGELRGRISRRPAAEAERVVQQARFATAETRRAELLSEVKRLSHDPRLLDETRTARDEARAKHRAAADGVHRIEVLLASARARRDAAETALADGVAQHERLDELADRSRHIGRLADLLSAFRNTVVATVGPTLASHAASLFADLTDREYDDLRVNPDTFDIQIVDAGRVFTMDRFSGSETDLANLALRVAISENVRLHAGGAVGLLVLDEVFGPLDDQRRERMLQALERLRARFRQVLVVTHASDVKEQLPNAIEVVKLPGRRATARVLVS